MQILAYVLGIGFLVACVLSVPLLRKIVHERTLKALALEGATIVPRFWSLSGLRLDRPAWSGDVRFESARAGGGRPGHLRLLATFKKSAPLLSAPAPAARDGERIRTGDEEFDRKIVVEGDPVFARKLLVPEMRARLMDLDRRGGRVAAIGEGAMEIDGPLLEDHASLREFLALCDAIVSGTVTSAGG